MGNGFILEGIKYVGTNLVSAVEDICIQGKEIVVKGCQKPVNGKINATKECCDGITTAKVISIVTKFIGLSLAISAGVSIATTAPAVGIYVLATALKVVALFLAADIVQVDKNTFKPVIEACESVGNVAKNIGQNLNDSGSSLKNMGTNLQAKGEELQNRQSNGGLLDKFKTKIANFTGWGAKQLGQGAELLGTGMQQMGKTAKEISNVIKNQGVFAAVKVKLSLPMETGDTPEETRLKNASKDTYVIGLLVKGAINAGRWAQNYFATAK